MPALMIELQPDGTVLVAPSVQPIDPANAESFPDMASALAAAGEVLAGSMGGPGKESDAPMDAGAGVNAAPTPEEVARSGDLEPSEDMEADMDEGFNKAKKGR